MLRRNASQIQLAPDIAGGWTKPLVDAHVWSGRTWRTIRYWHRWPSTTSDKQRTTADVSRSLSGMVFRASLSTNMEWCVWNDAKLTIAVLSTTLYVSLCYSYSYLYYVGHTNFTGWWVRKSVEVGVFPKKFSVWAQILGERGPWGFHSPTAVCIRKLELGALSYGIKISALDFILLSQCTHVTDRLTELRHPRTW